MLGQLLFEFGQMELNKDLLEAIKRTESRTGGRARAGGAGPPLACAGHLSCGAFRASLAGCSKQLGQLQHLLPRLRHPPRCPPLASIAGRQSRGSAPPADLDRIAFEYVVAEAAELLHSQLATVAAHSEEEGRQRALLRAYAVQAIATFADEGGCRCRSF